MAKKTIKGSAGKNIEGNATAIDPRFLELLACPLTKGPLIYDEKRSELISRSAKLAYPVRDGVPIMLPSEARVLDSE